MLKERPRTPVNGIPVLVILPLAVAAVTLLAISRAFGRWTATGP